MMKIKNMDIRQHSEEGYFIVHFDTNYTKNMANNDVMKKEDLIKLLQEHL